MTKAKTFLEQNTYTLKGVTETSVRMIQADAVRELVAAIEALGQWTPDKVTYFEARPTQDAECAKRWMRLSKAMAEAKSLED